MAFNADERARLLTMPRIGPTVLDRLEQAGIDSLERLHATGVDAAVASVCDRLGSEAWANRRQALRAALTSLVIASSPTSGGRP